MIVVVLEQVSGPLLEIIASLMHGPAKSCSPPRHAAAHQSCPDKRVSQVSRAPTVIKMSAKTVRPGHGLDTVAEETVDTHLW